VVVDGTEIAEEGEQIVDLGPKPRTGTQGRYEGEEAASRSKKVTSEEDPYDEELGLEMGEDGIVRGESMQHSIRPESNAYEVLSRQGRLSSTNSHLLRLTLPLPSSERVRPVLSLFVERNPDLDCTSLLSRALLSSTLLSRFPTSPGSSPPR
jgi:hypothetical protein